ncbi:MAG: flagellar basal body P-ring protein FlgI [Xanthomonadales bacterium]|nr:flagellar basal body P-ring protein FlgI [Xanthomonadales bacterium]
MNLSRILVAAGLVLMFCQALADQRIKDLAQVGGFRNNQLVGYGLVVGLDGTGDQTTQAPFTIQSLKSMLTQLGVNLPADARLQLKNVAAVAVHAELTPYAKPGQTIDITVSSIANATSLRGGSLLMTPLKGADGQVYAVAQGSLVVGGFGAQGSDGSKITFNVPSAGRIPNGATVERAVPAMAGGPLKLHLHTADFTTATELTNTINQHFGPNFAVAMDPATVSVRTPEDPTQRVQFVAQLENLRMQAGTPPARVVVNARTGTVVVGSDVRVLPTAISHGGLTVTVTESPSVVQPGPFSDGVTAVEPRSEITISEGDGTMFLMEPGARLSDIVDAVNQVGAAPGDIVAILEALKQAGALKAEFIVI